MEPILPLGHAHINDNIYLIFYLPYPLHEYQHHEIIMHSQYQHDHSQMTNVMEFVDPVVIKIIRYL